jgi:hypothetical protein
MYYDVWPSHADYVRWLPSGTWHYTVLYRISEEHTSFIVKIICYKKQELAGRNHKNKYWSAKLATHGLADLHYLVLLIYLYKEGL